MWREGRLSHLPDDQIDPGLARQLRIYRDTFGPELPLGVAFLMITCWRQIYGLICMGVYGHLAFAFDDQLPLFEDMIDRLLGLLGLTRSPRLR
ncbi:hypothetical protein [Sphaerisporangium fuscum]|uniref:hypothetical protein n=1 Tax=Sphaerisporangium fuscum TaxID=2835868 RepID=UPI001BDDA343|nr:hypothetical protein [Sphaerisporangium fuscum]